MYYAPLFLLPALVVAIPLKSAPVQHLGLERLGYKPGDITIVSATASGNGCPQNSFSRTISDDREGPTAAQADKTKQCQIHLSLNYPSGIHFTVVDATYHGWARLDASVTGSFISTYFFSQAASQTVNTRQSVSGDQWLQGDTYTKNDPINSASVIWSPCGANGILNVNNRISLTSNSPNGTGELSDDDATIAFTQQLNLQWSSCRTSSSSGDGGDFSMSGGSSNFTEG